MNEQSVRSSDDVVAGRRLRERLLERWARRLVELTADAHEADAGIGRDGADVEGLDFGHERECRQTCNPLPSQVGQRGDVSTNTMDAQSTQEATTADRVVLTLPGNPSLRGVASLVLGGIGSRIDLPYEKVDELQLAVLSVLGACDPAIVTIEIEIEQEAVLVALGPLPDDTVAAPGVRVVLDRLVDGVEPSRRETDAGSAEWVTLRLARPRAA